MSLKDKIKYLRKSNNLTQEQFAILINVKKHSIGDWETERSEPSIDNLKDIAKAFNITLNWLLCANNTITDKISFEQIKKYIGFIANTPLEKNIISILKTFNNEQLTIINNLLINTDFF